MPDEDSVLLVGGDILTLDPDRPRARAILVTRRRIAWVGDDPEDVDRPGLPRVDLSGTTVFPGFVNAHTHLTRLGLTLNAMDLSVAESLAECLAALQAIATVTPHPVIWAAGWDETAWPERRAPTAEDLAQAAGERPVMLTRADGHAVVVDRTSLSALPLARARGVERGLDGRPTGLLRQEAAQVAQRWFTAEMPEVVLAGARTTAAGHLATLGVTSAHEMGGPHRMGPADFDAWVEGDWPIEVVPYWGDTDLEFVTERGLRRAGGSLLLDGTVGSHSAALLEPYVDRAGSGQLYHDTGELVEFATAATRRGVQVAFHAVGDRAVQQALSVFQAVAAETGAEQIRRLGHRIEYAPLVTPAQVEELSALGLLVTVQPASDLALGDEGGAYELRLGRERARASNPLRALVDAGVPLAFGADSVAHVDPWNSIDVAAAVREGRGRLTVDEGLRAATVGGRLAAHQPNVGVLRPGHRADLAAFTSPEDPSARTCVLTMVAGRTVFEGGVVCV